MSSYNPRHYKLGISGLALLRNRFLHNKVVSKEAIKEIRNIVDSYNKKSSEEKIDEYNIKRGYDIWSETYDYYPNLLLEVEEPVVKQLIPKPKSTRNGALDVGCGTGRYSEILGNLGYSVTGVDQSSAMLSKAKSKVTDADFVEGEIDKLPFSSDSFDFAICALALTHFKSLEKPISEINRVVRKNGKIIISDQHPLFVALGGQVFFHDKEGNRATIKEYTHWHSSYLEIFRELGLKILDCREAKIGKKHMKLSSSGSSLSPEVGWAALRDLPLALIWVLQSS